ncbi:E3 SUMO-protein ligase SIZ1 [Daldinia childiae]|uniref:E3 SUMO-protein ligase SIZ1 n=1 Tax=Daldinia childiae TaxID=326645 RepID=UPI0014455765|nr:E3 SUMO-protein ligase SIZ1 [Daldinia childiae]KAF3063972.1 E3 SUMO-protein ligase SIZ1 [Daldinia childiae]
MSGRYTQPIANIYLTALHENYQSDPARYNAIRDTIMNIRGGNSGPQSMAPPSNLGVQPQSRYYNSYGSYQPAGSSMPQPSHGYSNGASVVGNGTGYPVASRATHSDNIFKNTPFYTIEKRIGPLHTCPVLVMNNHRNSITVTLKASDYPDLGRCATYSSTKLMVFCGSENTGLQDIQFPHQSEVKVNDDDIKHNLRGLKNKPGSTHPVDITPFLRLKQTNYTNKIEFTYALTTKVRKPKASRGTQKFYLALYVCKTHPIDELVTRIKAKKISKVSVIRENEYVQEVLENTPESCEQVTIEPDGQWRVKSEEPEPTRSRPPTGAKIEDDDDISILSDTHAFGNGIPGGPIGSMRNTMSTPSRSFLGGGTPNGGHRETPNTQRSGSSKRPAEVIDLTLSSDEDDEPIVRPPKRQNLGPTNGLNFPSAYSY